MKIEITHDIIAKKVFERGSNEDKAFLRATRLIRERQVAYADTKTYLTERELEFIEPILPELLTTISKEEQTFVKRSQRYVRTQFFKKMALAAFVGLVIGVVVLVSSMYYNKKISDWVGITSESSQLVSNALQKMDKNPTIAVNLVGKALKLDPTSQSAKQVMYLLYRDNVFYKDILSKKINANAIAFSPSSDFVAYAEKDFVFIERINGKLDTFKMKLHKGAINDIEFVNDSTILSIGDDDKMKQWNFITNQIVDTAYVERQDTMDIDLNALEMTPDKRYTIVGRGKDASDFVLMDNEEDETYIIDDVKGRIHDVDFSIIDADSENKLLRRQLMVTVGDDKRIMVYDVEKRTLLAKSEANAHPDFIYAVSIIPKGNKIATACNHEVIRIFEIIKNPDYKKGKKDSGLPYKVELFTRLTGHKDAVRSIRFSSNGMRMVSASYDNTAIIWNTKSWDIEYVLKGHKKRVYKAEFSPDGRYVVTAGRDDKVIIWNLGLKNPDVFPLRHQRRVSTLDVSPNGGRIYSATWGNPNTPMRSLIIWDSLHQPVQIDSFDNDIEVVKSFYQDSIVLAKGKELIFKDYKNGQSRVLGRADGTIKTIALATNNDFIAYAGRDDKLYLTGFKRGVQIAKSMKNKTRGIKVLSDNVKKDANEARYKDIYSVGISTNNQYVVAGRRNGSIVIWDVKKGVQLKPLQAHDTIYSVDNEIYTVNFIDETRFLTTGRDNTIRLFQIDAENSKVIRVNNHDGHAGGIRCLAIHPDPNTKVYVTGGGDKQLKLWDFEGNLIQVIDAFYSDKTECTGDVDKCEDDFGIVTAVDFTKDGSNIIFGNGNGTVKSIYSIDGAFRSSEIYKVGN
jgi:WD40 repeat protein